jgi:MFS family permease
MSFLALLRRDAPTLSYCCSFTFGSSVGQTFFVSLFMPSVAVAVQVSHAQLATLYGVATILSALSLPWLGRLLDRTDISRYGLAVGFAAMAGCVLMAASQNEWMVFAAMYLLRLFAQGLMPHVGLTGAARYFEVNRGRALSVVSLGHSAGEGLLPVVVVALVAWIGWRPTYLLAGAAVGLVMIPLATSLIAKNQRFREPISTGASSAGRRGIRNSLLRSAAFWAYLPLLLTPSLVLTALLFYQGFIADSKGLHLAVFAAAFVGFALVQIPTSLVVGPLVDRYGAVLPLVLHLAPLAIGTAVLAAGHEPFAVWCFLILAGMTTAATAILRTAVVAELVEKDCIAEARSFLAALIVVAAAAGPVIYSEILERGTRLEALLWGTAIACFVAAVPAVVYRAQRSLTAT